MTYAVNEAVKEGDKRKKKCRIIYLEKRNREDISRKI